MKTEIRADKETRIAINARIPTYLKEWLEEKAAPIHGSIAQQLIIILEKEYKNDPTNHKS